MKKLNLIYKIGVNTLKSSKMKSAIIIFSIVFLSGMANAKSTLDWTGLYGGVNFGGVFSDSNLSSHNLGFTNPNGTCNNSENFSSIFSGLQIGYARQFNRKIVMGVEADYTYNYNNQVNTACTCDVNPNVSDQFAIKNQQQGSVRARMGYALDNHLLPYFTAGGSLANLGMNYHNEGGDHYSNNTTQLGWLAGAGVEWNFANAWSVRGEYYYIAYSGFNMAIPSTYGLADPNGNAHININTNNVRAAINYRFS